MLGETEIRTIELQVRVSRCSEFDIMIEKFKIFKLTGLDQIPAEMIKSGGRRVGLEVHKIINSLLIKE
jgi:hypothetical protein